MMRTDNRYVENINERCRPSNIAILYNNLESQEWVDAKESLEDAGFDDEVTITKFLCSVLMVRKIHYDEWVHFQGKYLCHFHFCLFSQWR